MKLGRVCAVILLTFSCACASVNAAMDAWLGHNANELIIAWGPPMDVTSDGAGGQVLIYDLGPNPYSQAVGTLAVNDPTMPVWVRNSGKANLAQSRKRMFYVNATGAIYAWRAYGR